MTATSATPPPPGTTSATARSSRGPPSPSTRPRIAADGEDLATLAAPLPPGAIVEIDGERVEVDGALQIASDMPATYRVEIDAFPYRFFTAEIVAT